MMITYSFLKAEEGGQSRRDVLAELQGRGIKAHPAYSSYIGHTAVTVIGNKREQSVAERVIFS
jgi:hypothetical protein